MALHLQPEHSKPSILAYLMKVHAYMRMHWPVPALLRQQLGSYAVCKADHVTHAAQVCVMSLAAWL